MSILAENFVEHIQAICCTYLENEGDVARGNLSFRKRKGSPLTPFKGNHIFSPGNAEQSSVALDRFGSRKGKRSPCEDRGDCKSCGYFVILINSKRTRIGRRIIPITVIICNTTFFIFTVRRQRPKALHFPIKNGKRLSRAFSHPSYSVGCNATVLGSARKCGVSHNLRRIQASEARARNSEQHVSTKVFPVSPAACSSRLT